MSRKLCITSFLIFFIFQCDRDKSSTGPKELVTFSITPIEYSAIRQATPLGNTNPPGHVFPSNHIGFYLNGTSLVPVKAPARGTITTIYHNNTFNDNRIEIKHTRTFYTYFDHVKNIPDGVMVGDEVEAGDLIGYGDPAVAAVDLGVVDYDTTRQFLAPARYHDFSLHCGNPYLYFDSPVRDALLAKNPRTAEPRGGKIDFDIDGALAGHWFLPGTPQTYEASSYLYAANQLAFIYDMYDPAKIRITCGGTLSTAPFDVLVDGNTPDPAGITVSSGMIKYELLGLSRSTLLVQLLAARQIKAEVFAGKKKNEVSDFTAAAKIYIR